MLFAHPHDGRHHPTVTALGSTFPHWLRLTESNARWHKGPPGGTWLFPDPSFLFPAIVVSYDEAARWFETAIASQQGSHDGLAAALLGRAASACVDQIFSNTFIAQLTVGVG
jgi:hypothetical protein